MSTPEPELRWTAKPKAARAVVLVLHGGASRSDRAVRWTGLAVLRLAPFAQAITRAGGGEVAVARLRFALRGWNRDGAGALADARWALDELRSRYPDAPIGLVGHSLGGRVALRLGDEPDVVAIVGLAPWVERGDRATGGRHTRALLLHGTRDRMTSPRGSQLMAAQMRQRGVDAAYEPIPGDGHALLRTAWATQDRVATWLTETLLSRSGPARRTS